MRQQGFSAISLVMLLLTPFLIAAPAALRAPTHEGVVYTTDQIWSGNMSLDDNVTIANGATLTIQAGTHLNVTEDVTITIEGDFEIQGTPEEPVEIWGSWIADTSIQARWQGFNLTSGSSASVVHTNISDSRGGFDVESGATLAIDSTILTDTIIGVWAKGTLSGDGFACHSATTSCLRVDGTATLTDVTSSLSAEVVHVHYGGNANLGTVTSSNDADVIVLDDGSTFYGNAIAGDFTRLIRGSGSVTATVTTTLTGGGEVLVEADALSGLVVNDDGFCGTECAIDSLLIGSVEDVEFSSLYLTCGDATPCIDAQIDGELAFVGSGFPFSEINANGTFARLRGAGTVNINEMSVQYSNKLFDVSGSGELMITDSTLRFDDGGSISGWSLDISDTIILAEENGIVLLDVQASLSLIELHRAFSSTDTTSVGLRAVWSEIFMDDVSVMGWIEGIRCEAECSITGGHLIA